MSFCIINGVTYEIQQNGTTENSPEDIGLVRRTFNGTARSGVKIEKRSWSLLLAPLTVTQDNTLRATLALRAQVTCSGDFANGTSLTCYGKHKSIGFFKPTQAAGMFRVPQIDLFEV